METHVYDELAIAELKHWWCVGRRAILADTIAREVEGEKMRALDIGCGSGLNAKILETKAKEVTGIESEHHAINLAAQFAPNLRVVKGTFPNVRLDGYFDIVTLFDVLEHCVDDVTTLKIIHGLMTPSGTLMLTVPAFAWLWTAHDDIVHHKRRYTKNKLQKKIEAAGFRVERITYFNTLLFPAIVALRTVRSIFGITQTTSDYALPNPILNWIFGKIFGLEKYLLRYVNLPVGVSILCIAKRK